MMLDLESNFFEESERWEGILVQWKHIYLQHISNELEIVSETVSD